MHQSRVYLQFDLRCLIEAILKKSQLPILIFFTIFCTFLLRNFVYYPGDLEPSFYQTVAYSMLPDAGFLPNPISNDVIIKAGYFNRLLHIYDLAIWQHFRPVGFSRADIFYYREYFYSGLCGFLSALIVWVGVRSFLAGLGTLVIFYSVSFMEYRSTMLPELLLMVIFQLTTLVFVFALKKRSIWLLAIGLATSLLSVKTKETGIVLVFSSGLLVLYCLWKWSKGKSAIFKVFATATIIFSAMLIIFDSYFTQNPLFSLTPGNYLRSADAHGSVTNPNIRFGAKLWAYTSDISMTYYWPILKAQLNQRYLQLSMLILGVFFAIVGKSESTILLRYCTTIFATQFVFLNLLASFKIPVDSAVPVYFSNLQGTYSIITALGVFEAVQYFRSKICKLKHGELPKQAIRFAGVTATSIFLTFVCVNFSQRNNDKYIHKMFTKSAAAEIFFPILAKIPTVTTFNEPILLGSSWYVEGINLMAAAYWPKSLSPRQIYLDNPRIFEDLTPEMLYSCRPILIENPILEKHSQFFFEHDRLVISQTNSASLLLCSRHSSSFKQ